MDMPDDQYPSLVKIWLCEGLDRIGVPVPHTVELFSYSRFRFPKFKSMRAWMFLRLPWSIDWNARHQPIPFLPRPFNGWALDAGPGS
jgi:hypothetical protein